MMGRVLVVDDDEAGCRLVSAIFRPEGFVVHVAHDGTAALTAIRESRPDVVLLDLRLPDMDGLEVLARIRDTEPAIPVVMLTAFADVKTAVRATQLGAFDYLEKPIDPEEVTVTVRCALDARQRTLALEAARESLATSSDLHRTMGPSDAVAALRSQVDTVAATGFSVLVLGETGTGKELVARAIHDRSDRRDKPFVAIDCGAIPEALLESELFGHERGAFTNADRRKVGRVQLAEGGTLFLDEVGNLPIVLQAKVLRAIETREIQPLGASRSILANVRFVAATNDDLRRRADEGRFRIDLFFRLAQYTITLPPLRDRPSDIGPLAERFALETGIELGREPITFTPGAVDQLRAHDWPGNVRELRNVVRRAVLEARAGILERMPIESSARTAARAPAVAFVPKSLRETADEAAREAERAAICEALRSTGGNKSRAARALLTDYKTLHLKMKALGIRARDFTP